MKTGTMCASLILAAALGGSSAGASNWPQFMRTSEHTGDAADEELKLPLGLVAQVKLEDAVMTTPAVVGGLAYVVDQMGTAYCVDSKAGKIVWRAAPDGAKAMGSNTASPCVAQGRMYYGTTAGTFHVLDCRDGKLVKTINIGMPIISSPTFANDSIYFQALDAVVRCLDRDGNEKWTWDHYKRYVEPPEIAQAEKNRRTWPRGPFDLPKYGGGDVTISGRQVVTSIGWDLLCVEDKGKNVELSWCRRFPTFGPNAMSSSISGEWVYTCGVGSDGLLGMLRTALKDGADVFWNGRNAKAGKGDYGDPAPKDSVPGVPGVWTTAAVRGSLVTTTSGRGQIQIRDIGQGRTMTLWQDPLASMPIITSHALAKDHLVATTLTGQVLIVDLVPKTSGKGQPFIFRTASGKGIGSSPAISGGCVYFGSDDGCLYVLGPGGALKPSEEEKPLVAEPRSTVASATGKAYGFVTAGADPQRTNFVDDPLLKPPFRLRWATRAFGHFKSPIVASQDGDAISICLPHIVTCQEQATGRMRWRVRLPIDAECISATGLLLADNRVYVPAPRRTKGSFYCLDRRTGAIVWSAPIGEVGVLKRYSPVMAQGKVAFAHSPEEPKTGGVVVQAWDALTGAPAWSIELKAPAQSSASTGATDGTNFYFAAVSQDRANPCVETVAIEAVTGKALWRTSEVGTDGQFAVHEGRLYLFNNCLTCLSAKDGAVVWQNYQRKGQIMYPSIGPGYLAMGHYSGGFTDRLSLADGALMAFKDRGAQLGSVAHSCGPVVLTPTCAFTIALGGLSVRDTATGALLWTSPGFAPRACGSASIANGRVFWPSATSGVVFCWEPEK